MFSFLVRIVLLNQNYSCNEFFLARKCSKFSFILTFIKSLTIVASPTSLQKSCWPFSVPNIQTNSWPWVDLFHNKFSIQSCNACLLIAMAFTPGYTFNYQAFSWCRCTWIFVRGSRGNGSEGSRGLQPLSGPGTEPLRARWGCGGEVLGAFDNLPNLLIFH